MSGRHIHLQPLGGIAGDMFVAAMLDAFPHWRGQVFADIAAIVPSAVGTARLTDVMRNGIAARHFSLDEKLPPAAHTHAHSALGNGATPGNAHVPPAHHHHFHDNLPVSDYAGIRKLIERANLSGSTAAHALAILEIIARAESHIHRVALDEVHFHELAAWDSLMDVVAAGSVVSALGKATWSITALPLGDGQVMTQHGLLPIPAPATMRILESYPWRSDDVAGERVTPTGAAIVRYLVPPEHLSNKPEGTFSAGGYGAGTRDLPQMANVLRVMVFDQTSEAAVDKTTTAMARFDIGDMSVQMVDVAAGRLRRQTKAAAEESS